MSGNKKLDLDNISTKQMLGLMALAYAFSFLVRMIWVWQFKDTSSFYWNDQLMINTNDGYFFAAGVQQALEGLHQHNPRVFGLLDYGVIFFTTLLVKLTPMSLETAILYAPAIFSSLVVIPIILIARLYGKTWWGFFAALLGSITWSYYNRTMTGYYDTDMFSAMAPMFILYFLIKNTIDLEIRTALYAALFIIFYPFLYDQGLAIVYAMGIIYAMYMLVFHQKDKQTYMSLILIFMALIPLSSLGLEKPYNYLFSTLLVMATYLFLIRTKRELKELMIISGVMFILFLFLGNIFTLIGTKILSYTVKGTEEGSLHFYAVNQTVREAGRIPFETFANRTSGSIVGVIIALMGYILLVIKHRAFILALPLIGIGVFSLWGGLRFTVYAVPVAAMSAVYLFWVIAEKFIAEKKAQMAFVALLSAGMIYPNIVHIIGYKVPTVLNKSEVEDLVKLDKIASDKDYTLTWWDYGYPVWFYSDTSTLIDGGKHNNDNFIISTILFSDSPEQVANLSRLAVETYVDSNYSVVADRLFQDTNPNQLLEDLKNPDFKLPAKTREVYLYMPYRMMRIFPTVGVFGNLNLKTGHKKRNIVFYPTRIAKQSGSQVMFANGIVFDMARGILQMGKQTQKVYKFDMVSYRPDGKSVKQSELKHIDGTYAVVYLKSYGSFVIMDRKTYESAYVQMFMLDNYDKNLFELVVSSPYSKIFRVKK